VQAEAAVGVRLVGLAGAPQKPRALCRVIPAALFQTCRL